MPFFIYRNEMILIAESKTMRSELYSLSSLHGSEPQFETEAREIMDSVAAMSPAEVAAMLHCSGRLALTAVELAKSFSHSTLGIKTLEAFTGVVFRSLDASTLSPQAAEHCQQELRIVSTAYGILRPEDVVRPYRLEMSARVPGMSLPLKGFWKPKLTVAAGKYLKENPDGSLIAVLPADAQACFDWKLLRGLGSVGFVELRTYNDAGKLTTPRAERLKDRRGLFVRQLLEAGITTAEGLETFTSPDFEYLGQYPYPGRYAFLC